MDTNEKTTLRALAERTVEQLRGMAQPIVRVCGPLTTGGKGYEENAARLVRAEEILEEKGYTVFRFGDAEESIKDKGFSHAAVMEEFHQPVLESNLISEAFFLPEWEKSKGATWERDFIRDHTSMKINEFPEEWFA
jgi:hypothetical protein